MRIIDADELLANVNSDITESGYKKIISRYDVTACHTIDAIPREKVERAFDKAFNDIKNLIDCMIIEDDKSGNVDNTTRAYREEENKAYKRVLRLIDRYLANEILPHEQIVEEIDEDEPEH